MSEEPKLVTSSECQQIELWPGVLRRTMCWGDRMLVAEITLAKGADVPAHSHMHEQVGYVARGRLEWTVDGKTAILECRRWLCDTRQRDSLRARIGRLCSDRHLFAGPRRVQDLTRLQIPGLIHGNSRSRSAPVPSGRHLPKSVASSVTGQASAGRTATSEMDSKARMTIARAVRCPHNPAVAS